MKPRRVRFCFACRQRVWHPTAMVKEKGATPSRRLPSRSGRASFDGDPADEGAHTHNGEAENEPQEQEHGRPGSADSSSINGASGAENRAGAPAKEEDAPVAVTPRGRGRPRKKPLEPPPPVKAEEAKMEAADTAAAAAAAAPAAASLHRADGSSAASSPRSGGSSPRAVGGWETARPVVAAVKKGKEEDAAADGGGGNESDEWSDNDEVHDLPDEIKAQFGQVKRREREHRLAKKRAGAYR